MADPVWGDPAYAVQARGLTRVLDEGENPVTLVEDVSLSIRAGEFVAIVGASGSGKSSLLYLLGLLDEPTAGEVWVGGVPTSSLAPEERAHIRLTRLGFIFQFHFLLPEFTVLQNILMPMDKLGALPENARRARAMELLERFGIADKAMRRPGQLSGGQRQRVAVARALANDPFILLADEPTGNLDSKNAESVFELFREICEVSGKTVLTVTHDPDLAARCHREIFLKDGKLV